VTSQPIISGGAFGNPALDLLETLDRGLTAADLCGLRNLLHHWHELAALRIERPREE